MDGVNPDTVWTWNAIGKRARRVEPVARRARGQAAASCSITSSPTMLPGRARRPWRYANSDPVTGQAAWYDLRVRIEKAAPDEAARSPRTSRRWSRPPASAARRPCCATAPSSADGAGDDYAGNNAAGPIVPTAPPSGAGARTRHDQPAGRPSGKKLGLVIDLDTCVGCQACAVTCKEWNTGGHMAPLTDHDPYRRRADGVWFNRVHTYEAGEGARQPHGAFPALLPALREAGLRHGLPDRRLLQARRGRHRAGRRGPLHRLQAVLLGLPLRRARVRRRCRRDEEMHAVRRPHLQRESGRRTTACRPASRPARPRPAISAISAIPSPPSRKLVAERGGYDLMPEMGYRPTNKYLPPRPRQTAPAATGGARRAQAVGRGRRRLVPPLGRSRAVALTPCIPPSPSSSSPPPPAPATACSACSACSAPLGHLPPTAGFGIVGFGLALGAITGGLLCLDLPSRPPGARLARLLAVAHVLAVARRRCCRSLTYVPAGLFGIGWVLLRPRRRRDRRPMGSPPPRWPSSRSAHGDDLCLAEADPRLAQSAGWCRTIWCWRLMTGGAVARRAAARLRPGPALARRAAAAGHHRRLPDQADLLALHRSPQAPPARRRAPPASAPSARCGCFERAAHHRQLPAEARWASRSRASTPRSCAASRWPPASRARPADRWRRCAPRWPATACALLAAAAAMVGVLVERWLFFAEAKHTVTLYYGAESV